MSKQILGSWGKEVQKLDQTVFGKHRHANFFFVLSNFCSNNNLFFTGSGRLLAQANK